MVQTLIGKEILCERNWQALLAGGVFCGLLVEISMWLGSLRKGWVRLISPQLCMGSLILSLLVGCRMNQEGRYGIVSAVRVGHSMKKPSISVSFF